MFGHPRNPYHRVDCLRSRRRLRVEAAGLTLVDTAQTVAVYETALEPRLYVDPGQVRTAVLVPSATQTYCPYKGTATYWNAASATPSWRTSRGATRIRCPSPAPCSVW